MHKRNAYIRSSTIGRKQRRHLKTSLIYFQRRSRRGRWQRRPAGHGRWWRWRRRHPRWRGGLRRRRPHQREWRRWRRRRRARRRWGWRRRRPGEWRGSRWRRWRRPRWEWRAVDQYLWEASLDCLFVGLFVLSLFKYPSSLLLLHVHRWRAVPFFRVCRSSGLKNVSIPYILFLSICSSLEEHQK